MSKKQKNLLTSKNLGLLLLIGLIIQFVLPQIKLNEFVWISTLIYLLVGLYLFFK